MDVEELMGGLAEIVGCGAIVPDENGVYRLDIDDMLVSFAEQKATGELLTMAEVGVPPPEGRERLYRALLEAAFLGEGTGGAAFSVDPESESVCLHRADRLADMDLERFRSGIERFVNVLESWRNLLADFSEVAPAQENADAEDKARERQCQADGFIKV